MRENFVVVLDLVPEEKAKDTTSAPSQVTIFVHHIVAMAYDKKTEVNELTLSTGRVLRVRQTPEVIIAKGAGYGVIKECK